MRDRHPLRRQRERADPGIAEQVEHLGAFADAVAHPGPDRRHVRKEAQMPERRVLRGEAQIVPADMPAAARHIARQMPAAAAILVRCADEIAVRLPCGRRGGPHRLRLGPDEAEPAIAFQLAAMPRIDQPVIVPRLGDEGGEIGHAAAFSVPPTVASASPPASARAPASRASPTVTASSAATSSAPGTTRPWICRLRAR